MKTRRSNTRIQVMDKLGNSPDWRFRVKGDFPRWRKYSRFGKVDPKLAKRSKTCVGGI